VDEAALSEVAFTEAFKRASGFMPHAYLLDLNPQQNRRAVVKLPRGEAVDVRQWWSMK
jgi:hypothetical protein